MSLLNVSAVESKFINYNKLLFNNLKIATTLKSKNVTSQELLTVLISASRDPSSRYWAGFGMTPLWWWFWEEAAIRKQHFDNVGHPGANRRFFLPFLQGKLSSRMSLRVGLCEGEKANEGSLIHLLQASYAKPLHPDF